MVRTAAVLTGGILLGVLAMLAAGQFGSSTSRSPDGLVRDIANVPRMDRAAAERHRSEQYAGLDSVEQIAALPTEFARSSALYALAGRSDSAGVQALIHEANRIADDVERADFLNILFFRLTEIDPRSALALAGTGPFAAIRSIEETVWHAWARNDLESALFAAKTRPSSALRNAAAQSLYAAFGYLGNETTDRIELETGIGPDRSTRARYLYQLADRSPADAIAYINSLARGFEQQEYVSWLGSYLSLRDPRKGLEFADQFRVAADSERFRSIIRSNIAQENPQGTIERLLAGGPGARSGRELHTAIRALASTDIDAAKRYFEQAQSSDDRMILGSAIANALAISDPLEALRWARENDGDQHPLLQMSVLGQIAQTDAELALAEALKLPNAQVRSSLVSNVVQHLAQIDPVKAAALLDQIEDRHQRQNASRQLASAWIRQDPERAIEWILGHENAAANQMLQVAAHTLLRSDVNSAIRLLPRLDALTRANLSRQIAHKLAAERSLSEAQSFIRQFEGQQGYELLQASVVGGIAQTDVLTAKQLADQLADRKARDKAYEQVIVRQAQIDALQAAGWLNDIGDEQLRGTAAGQLALHWYNQDSTAAMRWVNGLPAGSMRDDAILNISSAWHEATAAQDRLIASMVDRGKRGHAKLRRVYALMRTDPDRARELLQDEEIPADERQRLGSMSSQYGLRF